MDCLSTSQICDLHQDCKDNSDEDGCGSFVLCLSNSDYFDLFVGKTMCRVGQWLCPNEKCIDMKHVCDEVVDCADGSDEGNFCRNDHCGSDHIRCPSGQCILNSKVNKFFISNGFLT